MELNLPNTDFKQEDSDDEDGVFKQQKEINNEQTEKQVHEIIKQTSKDKPQEAHQSEQKSDNQKIFTEIKDETKLASNTINPTSIQNSKKRGSFKNNEVEESKFDTQINDQVELQNAQQKEIGKKIELNKQQNDINVRKQSSEESEPSSTSSDKDYQSDNSSSQSSKSEQSDSSLTKKQQQQTNQKEDLKENKKIEQQNAQSYSKFKEDDNSSDNDKNKQEQKKKSRKNSGISKKNDNENQENSLESDDEEEEEEEYQSSTQTSIVVETSPKGRFKRFNEELGRGAYKIVYKGVDHETGREIAWNVINLKRLPKQDRIRIKSEIDLIKKLQHKNIIHFISAWINKEREQVVFITEMITGGSLRKYVKKIKHPRLKVIKGWCTEILQGLVYLHEQNPHPIIHRDLKCDNILINSNSGEIRIGDLGLSTPMANSFTTSVLGTPEFMAPELYEECYDTAVDIYAFGMCVLEMVTLERPYKECQNPAQIYNKVIQGIRPLALERIEDEEVKQFILQCLTRADKRPTAKELLESPFLQDLESEKNNQVVKVVPKKITNFHKQKPLFNLKRQGSTILEEEEENTDNELEMKKPQPPEVIHRKPSHDNLQQLGTHTQKIEGNIDIQNKDNLLQEKDQVLQKQSTQIEQQEESNKDPKGSSSQSKKKSSKVFRKKKLNESVNFLRKIDKKKQQKMILEGSIPQNNEESNDSKDSDSSEEDQSQVKAKTENILAELDQEILESQKLQYQKEQDTHIAEVGQIDKINQTVQENIAQPVALSSFQQKEQHSVQQVAKPVFKKQQSTQQMASSFQFDSHDNVKRQVSNDNVSSPHLMREEVIKNNNQKQSIIQQQIDNKYYYSDYNGQKPNQTLTTNGTAIPNSQSQTLQEELFDQQTSGDEESSQHDSEVDSIQDDQVSNIRSISFQNKYDQSTPKVEIKQHLTERSSFGNTSTTKNQQLRFQHQQSNMSNQSSHSPSQLIPAQPIQLIHSQQNLIQGINSPHGETPLRQTDQLDFQKAIAKQQQVQGQKQIPLQPKKQSNEDFFQQNLSQQQVTTPKPSLLQKQQSYHQDSAKRQQKAKQITLSISRQLGLEKEQEITFQFDPIKDTPDGVAKEMIKELQLPESKLDDLIMLIKQELEEKNENIPAVSTSKKGSPIKISKDSAWNVYKPLTHAIDTFIQNITTKGISIEEFVEALDGLQEEKSCRKDFLIQMYQSRKLLKIKLDEIARKQQEDIAKKQLQQQQFQQQKVTPILQVSTQDKSKQQANPQGSFSSAFTQHRHLKRVGSNQEMGSLAMQYDNEKVQQKQVNSQLKVLFTHNIYKNNPDNTEEEVKFLQQMLQKIQQISQEIKLKQQSSQTGESLHVNPSSLLKVDSNFNDQTEKVLIKFQESVGLSTNGVVTEEVWKKLVKVYDNIQNQEAKKHQIIKELKQQAQPPQQQSQGRLSTKAINAIPKQQILPQQQPQTQIKQQIMKTSPQKLQGQPKKNQDNLEDVDFEVHIDEGYKTLGPQQDNDYDNLQDPHYLLQNSGYQVNQEMGISQKYEPAVNSTAPSTITKQQINV